MFNGKKAQPPIRTLIGEGSVLQGEIRFSDGLRIDGEVRGDVVADDAKPSVVVISERAKVIGRVHAAHVIVNGEVQLLINTPMGKHAQRDDYTLRQAAIAHKVPYTTTLSAASAASDAILALRSRTPTVRSLQEWHERVAQPSFV